MHTLDMIIMKELAHKMSLLSFFSDRESSTKNKTSEFPSPFSNNYGQNHGWQIMTQIMAGNHNWQIISHDKNGSAHCTSEIFVDFFIFQEVSIYSVNSVSVSISFTIIV